MLRTTKEGITVSVAETRTNRPVIDLYAVLEPSTLAAFLEDRFEPRVARGAELLERYKKFLTATVSGIANDQVNAAATDFAKMIRIEIKEVDDTRVALKAPVLAASRQIDGKGKELTDPLLAASVEIERRVTAFLKKKDREARQAAAEAAARAEAEAQRLMDEAAATGSQEAETAAVDAIAEQQAAEAVVEAPTPELSRFKTANQVTAALRDDWQFEVLDLNAVPAHFLMLNEAAVKLAIKQGVRVIPGLKIENRPKVAIR